MLLTRLAIPPGEMTTLRAAGLQIVNSFRVPIPAWKPASLHGLAGCRMAYVRTSSMPMSTKVVNLKGKVYAVDAIPYGH